MSLIPFAGAVQKFNRQRGGYQIERSLRFNSADTAYLSRTPGSASNRKTWTWSGWVKRCEISTTERTFFSAGTDNNNFTALAWINDALYLQNYTGGTQVVTNTTAVYRDASAWYHIVLALDTTQATAADRAKIYVNGVQQAGFSGSSFSLNQDFWVNFTYNHTLGARQISSIDSYTNQYMTEINFIDGSALDPTSFGETDTDTGVWKPKAYEGEYGTNGFYLNFSDNSGTTSTTLGKDSSGNGNNWTPNNFSVTAGAGNDSLVDTPTPYGTDTGAGGEVRGNYATLNPLDATLTLVNGNLNSTAPSNVERGARGTIGVSSGKWYYEYQLPSDSGTPFTLIGWASQTQNNNSTMPSGVGATGWAYYPFDQKTYHNGTASAVYGTSGSANDIIMVALDLDNSKIYWGRNGTWFNSGNPASGTNAAYTNVSGTLFPWIQEYNKASTINFGQRPFAYTAPSGFKALCTQNLPEPTIKDGGDYFNTVLYTGNGSTQSITGVGFQPDFVWIKRRSGDPNVLGNGHNSLYDVIRGATKELYSDLTSVEATNAGSLTSFNTDGFSLGSEARVNANANTHVAWNWVANGVPTANNNSEGSITSTVSVNTTSGFSIVTYTGTADATATFGHGLGVTPAMVIIKAKTGIAGTWRVWHTSLASTGYLNLSGTNAATTDATIISGTKSSTVFGIGNNGSVNGTGYTYVAYCFAAIPGYSAFGSYTGNGSTDGPFCFTGFRPKYVMVKRTDSTGGWVIFDSSRDTYNVAATELAANSAAAEVSPFSQKDFLSNGFKIRNTQADHNANGGTYIYAAFSEAAFKYSLAR